MVWSLIFVRRYWLISLLALDVKTPVSMLSLTYLENCVLFRDSKKEMQGCNFGKDTKKRKSTTAINSVTLHRSPSKSHTVVVICSSPYWYPPWMADDDVSCCCGTSWNSCIRPELTSSWAYVFYLLQCVSSITPLASFRSFSSELCRWLQGTILSAPLMLGWGRYSSTR